MSAGATLPRVISIEAGKRAAAAYVGGFRDAGVTLPLEDSVVEPTCGVIVDATGRPVFVVDPSRLHFSDAEADAIAHLILLVVNGIAAEVAS